MINYIHYTMLLIILGLAIYIFRQGILICKYKKYYVYFNYLMSDIPLGLYLKDLKGNILFANEKFAQFSGISRKVLEHKNVSDIFPKYLLDQMYVDDARIIEDKENVTIEEIIAIKRDEQHFYRILKSPVLDSKKNVCGFIVLLKEIDEEKEIESCKKDFVATLTHDLKTPNASQMNIISMLLSGSLGELNPQQKEFIELMSCSCKYVSDLVSTIMDTYCYEDGNIKLKCEQFDIVLLISRLCKALNGLAQEKNQKIVFKPYKNTCVINADRLQIKRVLVNLISNAISYGFQGTTINVDLENKNGQVVFSISNKSHPIPEEELATLFERYKRTKFSYFNKVSTGLGLYLSKKIIEMHNGEVFAKSSEDGTCVFGFNI